MRIKRNYQNGNFIKGKSFLFFPMTRDELLIPRLLMDKYNIRILSATAFEPKSAQELSVMFDIPIATCYRKLKELEMAGLIVSTGKLLTKEGKRFSVYKSQVRSIDIFFKDGAFKMNLALDWQEQQTVVLDMHNLSAVRNHLSIEPVPV